MRKSWLNLCTFSTVVALLFSQALYAADSGLVMPLIDGKPSFDDFENMASKYNNTRHLERHASLQHSAQLFAGCSAATAECCRLLQAATNLLQAAAGCCRM